MNTTTIWAMGLLGLGLAPAVASAQGIGQEQFMGIWTPNASPGAQVGQTVGLTNIEIVYHRPGVGDRELWGSLVPWDQVWRTGANENTTITFSTDVTIDGQPLAAGTYGLHTIPGEAQWTVIFSRDHHAWGSYSYDEANDALRITTTATPTPPRERLSFTFDEVTDTSTTVHLQWGVLDVPFTVGVDLEATVLASMRQQLTGLGKFGWQAPYGAAKWCLDNETNLEEALTWADQSIQAEDRYANQAVKSDLLLALGRDDEAEDAMKAALAMATAGDLHFHGRTLQGAGKHDEALAIYKRNARENPDVWFVDVGLARGHAGLGRYSKAAKYMKAAVERGPEAQRGYLQGLVDQLERGEAI